MDARSPEELETLLEDAVLLADGRAAAALFEPAGVLHLGTERRGPVAIARAVPEWRGFVAGPRVVCGSDLALVLGPAATTVARRTAGVWRYVVAVATDGR